jgi:hypothetical protein
MSSFSHWLRDWLPGTSRASAFDRDIDQDSLAQLLAEARSLAREGKLRDAARSYAALARVHGTPESWLEHAELQLALGEHFGAACNAVRVLEVEPQNPRALAVRDAVLVRVRASSAG